MSDGNVRLILGWQNRIEQNESIAAMFDTTANCELPHRSDGVDEVDGVGEEGGWAMKPRMARFIDSERHYRSPYRRNRFRCQWLARNDRPYLKTFIKLSMIILQESLARHTHTKCEHGLNSASKSNQFACFVRTMQ